MADDGGVGPGMLCVQSHGAVLEHDQVEGFIEPPEWKQTADVPHLIRNKHSSFHQEDMKPAVSTPTCRSTSRAAAIWRSCTETWRGCSLRNAAPCRPGSRRRQLSRWNPGPACSCHGWSRYHELWPKGSCKHVRWFHNRRKRLESRLQQLLLPSTQVPL